MAQRLIRGDGCVWASPINTTTGQGTDWKEIGETPNLSISISGDFLESRNTCLEGSPITVREFINPVVTVNMTIKEFVKDNMERVLFGTAANVAESTLSNVVWNAPNGTAFEVGKWYSLPSDYANTDTLTFTDNAGTPATINSSHYEIDKLYGMWKLTDAASYVLSSVKISGVVNQADANAAPMEKIGIATGAPKPFALKFKGNATFEGVSNKFLLTLYKVTLEPGNEIAFKSVDAFLEVPMSGRALANASLPSDPVFGNTGRFIWIGDAA